MEINHLKFIYFFFQGLWTGAVVVLSGLMGIMAGQKRTNLIYIVAYLLMSVLALAAIGLLLIFAATGLARDSDAPHGYFIDQEVNSMFSFFQSKRSLEEAKRF